MIPRPPLAISLAGLERRDDLPWSGGPREEIEWAIGLGFDAVQLDGARLRARDLDRSSRRDLAATLRRASVAFCGLDLWIPASHWGDPAHADRALAAALGAVELAAELAGLMSGAGRADSRPVVGLALPPTGGDEALRALTARAETVGAAIADHAAPASERTGLWSQEPGSPLGIGIDPALVLLSGRDPAVEASRAGAALRCARLSDASEAGVRVAPGSGRLDELAYLVAVSIAGHRGPQVLDLRGVADQDSAARGVLARWRGESPLA